MIEMYKNSDTLNAQRNKTNKLSLKRPLSTILFILIISGVGWICYSGTLDAPFYYDDFFNIVDDPTIRLTKLNWDSISRFALSSGTRKIHRPVSTFTFALNYFFGRYNVIGYHLVNIFIHIFSGLLLFIIIRITVNLNFQHNKDFLLQTLSPVILAFFTSIIWVAHPLNIQSVTYIVQRMNSLASMFYLLSMIFYIYGRIHQQKNTSIIKKKNLILSPVLYFTGCVMSGFLAVTSKQIAATLPVFIFLYEWFFFQGLSYRWLRSKLKPIGAFLVIFIGILLYLNEGTSLEKIFYRYDPNVFTFSQRIHTELRVVIFYISLLFYPNPFRLSLDHGYPLSNNLIDPPTTILCLFTLLMLLGLAVYSAKNNRLVSFSILWYLGNLVIESSVIGLDIIYEHRNYLPSMMICLMFAKLLFIIFKRQKFSFFLCMSTILLFLCTWTYQRNMTWKNPITFWEDCVKKSPENARPGINLGLEYMRQGNLNLAIHQFHIVAMLKPKSPKVASNLYFNWGEALLYQGKIDEAIKKYNKSIKILPYNDYVHISKAQALIKLNLFSEAIVHLKQAIKLNIYNTKAYFLLGRILSKQGEIKTAIQLYQEAVRIDNKFIDAKNNLGNLFARQGMTGKAIQQYQEILEINPEHELTLINIGNTLAMQAKLEEAAIYYLKVLKINPSNSAANKNLGKTYLKLGELAKSETFLRESIKLDPEDPETKNTLGIVLTRQHRFKEAINFFEQALVINPGYLNALKNLQKVRSLSQQPVKPIKDS
jgi:tetratricopeptide (TPR) repeat protein